MNAPAADRAGWDRPTVAGAGRAAPGAPGGAGQGEETGVLLALGFDGEIVATLPAARGPVLVGRSSRCGLRCEDPRFPGVAGEVILHPLPLFRSMGGKPEKGDPQRFPVRHLAPGVPLPLGRYRLWLLRPGFSLKNRKRGKRRGSPFVRLLLISTLLLPVAAGGVAVLGKKDPAPIPPSSPPAASVASPGIAEQVPLPAHAGSPAVSSAAPTASPLPAPIPPAAPLRAAPAAEEQPPPGVSPGTLKAALDLARDAFLAGDPGRAGAALRTFLPLMSAEQIKESVAALEPVASPLFRKAYMELPYQPGKSVAALLSLAGCGLPDLPSVAKARGLAAVRRPAGE
jgi:hypothetical protein